MLAVEFIARDTDGKRTGDKEDDDQRVAELFEEALPKRILLGWSQDVDSMGGAAFGDLGVRKAGIAMFFCHMFLFYVFSRFTFDDVSLII